MEGKLKLWRFDKSFIIETDREKQIKLNGAKLKKRKNKRKVYPPN